MNYFVIIVDKYAKRNTWEKGIALNILTTGIKKSIAFNNFFLTVNNMQLQVLVNMDNDIMASKILVALYLKIPGYEGIILKMLLTRTSLVVN